MIINIINVASLIGWIMICIINVRRQVLDIKSWHEYIADTGLEDDMVAKTILFDRRYDLTMVVLMTITIILLVADNVVSGWR